MGGHRRQPPPISQAATIASIRSPWLVWATDTLMRIQASISKRTSQTSSNRSQIGNSPMSFSWGTATAAQW